MARTPKAPAVADSGPSVPGRGPGMLEDGGAPHARDGFVTRHEFRMFRWLGMLLVASFVGGFGFLFRQSANEQVALERVRADLLQQLQTEVAGLRRDMTDQAAGIRQDMTDHVAGIRQDMTDHMAGIRQDMTDHVAGIRQDMTDHVASIRRDMNDQHAAVRRELGDVRERVVRIEVRVGASPDGRTAGG